MDFIKLNFFLGICMYCITNLISKKKTEREIKENELELKRSCEELEENLSYFMNRPNLAKDLEELIKCEWKRQLIRIAIMQIPALNILFFLSVVTDRVKEWRG
jgi:hypothetical protein